MSILTGIARRGRLTGFTGTEERAPGRALASVASLDTSAKVAPLIERLLADARARRPLALPMRERLTELPFDLVFIGAVVAMTVGFGLDNRFQLGPALAL